MDIREALKQEFKNGTMKIFNIHEDIWLVPCVTNFTQNKFKPLLKPLKALSDNPQFTKKQEWSPSEDEYLSKIVNLKGSKAWSSIAKELNALFHNGDQKRNGRHCRERWYNHVDPSVKKGAWTEQEDQILTALHREVGGRWSEIAKKLPGRTENSVKNRFKALEKKGNLDYENKTFFNFCSLDNEIQTTPFELDSLLFSPQITGLDYSGKSETGAFDLPSMMRPIQGKPMSQDKVFEAKQRLQSDLFGVSASPSDFLYLRNT